MSGIAWFIDNLDDVRSDFSVYHRVDEVELLTADRFVAFLYRLPVYEGAVRHRVREHGVREQEPVPSAEPVWNDIRDLMATDPLYMGQGTAVTVPAE